jgi:hypothetical protein
MAIAAGAAAWCRQGASTRIEQTKTAPPKERRIHLI